MSDPPVTRRAAIVGGLGIAASLGGCVSTSATKPGSGPAGGTTAGGDGGSGGPGLLRAGGSSTVYPITSKAASYWGSNPPPSDEEYWGPSRYGIDTDERLADYWAGRYGFEGGSGTSAPYPVTVNLSHSGTGLENLRAGRVDIGDSSAPVSAELPEATEEDLAKFTDHVVGVDAQPVVVSREIYDAGVTSITGETLKAIYAGDLDDWSEVEGYDGPEKSIQAVGRAEGSGTDTAFRLNLLGDPNAPIPGVDVRKGQNQQVKTLVTNSDNAVAYLALAFVDDSVPAITLSFDGTEFVPGKNLADPDYPLSRDLHCYTYEGTSRKEAAFLNMIVSDFGQEVFVKSVGYSRLTDERQRTERENLPDPVA